MSKTNGIAIAPDEGSRLLERRLAAQLLNQYAIGELDTIEVTDPDIFPSPDLRQLVRAMKDGQSYSDILIGPLQSTALELEDDYKITARSSQLLTVLEDGWIAREIERAVRLSEGAETGRGKLQALRAHLDQIEARTATTATAVWFPTQDNRPEELDSLLTLKGVKVLEPGNMMVVVGGAGVGKSALLEGVVASTLNPHCDSFGFTSKLGMRTLLVDGERNRLDHWRSADRTRRRAGLEGWHPDYTRFALFSMIPTPNERMQVLTSLIDEFKPELLILDSLTDFLREVNNEGEATDVINRFSAMSKAMDMGILASIHPNPNSEKARGHVGSAMWRHGEFMAFLKRNPDDSRTLDTNFSLGKNRNDTDRVSTSFRWSDDHRMFVSCASPDPILARKTEKAEQLATRILAAPTTWGDAVQRIMDEEQVSKATAKRRLDAMREAGLVEKTTGNVYQLSMRGDDEIPF